MDIGTKFRIGMQGRDVWQVPGAVGYRYTRESFIHCINYRYCIFKMKPVERGWMNINAEFSSVQLRMGGAELKGLIPGNDY